MSVAAPVVLGVGALAKKIRGTLEGSLGVVHVRGEISNLRQPGSGHLYFSLKEERASIRAVLFRGQARHLRFRPEHGQEVIATGRVTFYEAGGDAQIICDNLEPVGAGALALAFEQLKVRLAEEGLFDPARKKALPFLPLRVGVVTSPTGAAIRDFLQVLRRRFPGAAVLVAPARVQGQGAAAEIAEGIRRLDESGRVDLIVATRGGGSIEDLWAFNEEVVARAIAGAQAPVVSAVGHEVDFTIADFVADLRAPTPTGAAELIAPVERDLREGLRIVQARLLRAEIAQIERARGRVQGLASKLGDPRGWIVAHRLELDGRLQRAAEATRRTLSREGRRLDLRRDRLQGGHPARMLQLQRRRLVALRERLLATQTKLLRPPREAQGALVRRLIAVDLVGKVQRRRADLGALEERLFHGASRLLYLRRRDLLESQATLEALSPLAVLARGYAIAFDEAGHAIRSAGEVREGQRIEIELGEGSLEVEVVARGPSRREKKG